MQITMTVLRTLCILFASMASAGVVAAAEKPIELFNGKTLDGECIVVRSNYPGGAETLAQEGLRDTIAAARSFSANTGLQAEVEMRPQQ